LATPSSANRHEIKPAVAGSALRQGQVARLSPAHMKELIMAIVSFHFSGRLAGTLAGASGIKAGDFFSGHFAFDSTAKPTGTTSTSATYPLASFAAGAPHVRLAPFDLSIRVSTDPQDPSIQVYGESPFELHVGVLFRGPSGVLPNTNLPDKIDLSKFLIENITICDVKSALFGADQATLPPPGAKVFLRGKISCITVASGIPSV
jgi:hypothetical protein